MCNDLRVRRVAELRAGLHDRRRGFREVICPGFRLLALSVAEELKIILFQTLLLSMLSVKAVHINANFRNYPPEPRGIPSIGQTNLIWPHGNWASKHQRMRASAARCWWCVPTGHH